MSGAQGGSLQNVLSISTAANNRYLLHFNSYNSLTQWTAGIRLAMFEHATLQEAYTGSLIAGKGRFLNNIKMIMERSRFTHEDWTRVRFGAGTPWKRCWCVVSPPDEKEYQKSQKSLKKSAYDRDVKVPKGDIKFYDTRKVTKKTKPLATITDAYAAYAIYPQSKPLIDQSTLVKLEGLVTIHTTSETTTEGFVFVMPEVHAAVSGFEMLLRWLFPVYDTFALYGRPSRLIADTLDQRGLMFALPQDRRYGYLDTLDVSNLIHAPGSSAWSERQWRKEMKKMTSERMSTYRENGLGSLRQLSQRRSTVSRTSLPGGQGGVRFDDGSDNSGPPSRTISPAPKNSAFMLPKRTDSAPGTNSGYSPHKRSASEAHGYRKYLAEKPSRLSYEQSRPEEDDLPPPPPRHGVVMDSLPMRPGGPGGLERIQSEAEVPTINNVYDDMQAQVEPAPSLLLPVESPPAFQHTPGARPANQPMAAPELRRAHSNVDAATLYQMQDAVHGQRTPEEEFTNGQNNDQNRVISFKH
jgi:CCR4-NOT transcriptional complex subunit CAF120